MASPKNKKANESQFFFFCGSVPPDTFEVMNFTGTDTISRPFKFSIMLISHTEDLDPSTVVNKPATLYFYRDQEYFSYSGIVSELQLVDRHLGHYTYQATLVPKMWLLSLSKRLRVFQKLSVPDIIKKVLSDGGVTEYEVNLKLSYSPQEFVLQYQETDLNFISRLMEGAGIWYFFKEAPIIEDEIKGGKNGTETLVITDDAAAFADIDGASTISYVEAEGMTEQSEGKDTESMSAFRANRRMVPTEVMHKNYNYRTPEVDVSATRKIKDGDAGAVYEYGSSVRNVTEAKALADVEAARLAVNQKTFEGSCNCRGFRAGKRFTLEDHFMASCNDTYILTKVSHEGAHATPAEGSGAFTYANQFACIASSVGNLFRPPLKAAVPRVNGVLTAKIEANGGQYAAIDDQGRYKVRFPFDLSGTGNYDGSKFVRLAQPYSGQNYGIHFPSHEGTEMVLACIDGDPNRPIGLATVPNANTVSPVVVNNKMQSVIRTAGKNEMVMHDEDGKQKVTVKTAAAHTMLMDDENKCVSVKTTNGNQMLLDDKNELVEWNGKSHKITMTYKSGEECIEIMTATGHAVFLDDANKLVGIQTKDGHKISMDDNGKKITLQDSQGKNTVTLDGNGGLILKSQGKIQIEAQQDLEIKAMNIKMTANAAIEAKATSDLKLKGMNLDAQADMGAKIGGMTLEAKGKTTATFEGGAKADFKGGAMASLTGTLVKIN